MGHYVTILKQLPLEERNYTDRMGQPQTFASRGFVLTDGIDTYYAEAVGDMARAMPQYDPNTFHCVQTQVSVREYTDREGKVHYSNEIRILKLV